MRQDNHRKQVDGDLMFHPLCTDRLADALAQSLAQFADTQREAEASIERVTAMLRLRDAGLSADQIDELTRVLNAAQHALAVAAEDPASASRDDIATLARAVRELLLTIHGLTRPD